MPTARPRHVLTETDDLAAAIDAAATQYPGETRSELLRRLVRLGATAINQKQDRHRRNVIARAGRHPGMYPPGYLEGLRSEWPE
jgi:metal-responsive CopG/Arc/MetJ family transcriptional regulator